MGNAQKHTKGKDSEKETEEKQNNIKEGKGPHEEFFKIVVSKARKLIISDEIFIKKHKHIEPVVTDLTISTIIVVRVIILFAFSIILEWILGFTNLNPLFYQNIAIWFPVLVYVILSIRRYKTKNEK